ncbi:DUF4198 domain-containing protein [Aurantiacibacter zhengii]|nr:DUF4198 domain-containing protein [Aurantiacibacter zhengii]
MFAKTSLYAIGLALGLTTLIPSEANAHRRWLLPSSTVLAGDSETITVDAAASNELFVFEHRPLRLDSLVITGPDGQSVQPQIIGSGSYRSVFDLPLAAQGTYRVALVSNGSMGSYELNGARHRFRGDASEVPEGATDVRMNHTHSRTETFVTLGAPSDTALQPVNSGLEMIAVSHPNDIVAGEPATVRFLIDGQPAAGLEVEFVEGNTRYRDNAGIQNLVTDAEGQLTLEAANPGMYYLEASSSQDGIDGEPDRRSSYTAVLEFLPL